MIHKLQKYLGPACFALLAIFSLAGHFAISTLSTPTPAFAEEQQPLSQTDCPKGTWARDNWDKATKDGRKIYTIAQCSVKPDDSLMPTITTIINVVVSVLGIVAVGVIVLGGVTFATSQGDAAKTAKAKNTILFGVVGLIVAILAFAIVNFVLGSVFSGDTPS